MKKLAYISALALFFSCFISCKKDKAITSPSAKLTFSQDSILFDTVFTSIGSTTKLFRIHNKNNGKLIISSLKLARGTASFFRLNVDGVPGKSFTNLEIAAQDSMYIFVEVTINPAYDPITSPFIYKDSILFEINGNQQHFDLIAFGQNAYYHMPNYKIIESPTTALYYSLDTNVVGHASVTWKNDKPHLIYGYLVVDSLHNLIIPQNTKIYLHDGAGIWVYRFGNIQINGAKDFEVTFQGDRLEQEYKDVPGQWDRIWINEGYSANIINYAIIKNATIGIHAGYSLLDGYENGQTTYTPPNTTRLFLTNTIIQNCSYAGILGHCYNIDGGNDVVVNCGSHLLEFDYGGNYTFYQSTFANYWEQTNNSSSSSSRTTPSFVFNNYFNGNQPKQPSPFDTLLFGNCIFDGSLAEEFNFDTIGNSSPPGFTDPSVFAFNYCFLKTGNLQQNKAPTNTCQISQGISYVSPSTYNFVLNPGSAPLGAGRPQYNGGYIMDIKGNSPSTSATNPFGYPNMGAYQ
ncbi:MAG: hypothetical protein ABI388_03240 [Bacteroidia bacterium]